MIAPSMLPWQVLQSLQTAYQKILIRDGYLTNLGENVNLEDPSINEDALPVLVITGEPSGAGRYQGDQYIEWALDVTVEASIKAGRDDSQLTAWQAHADILAATPKPREKLPKGAHSLKITDAKILQPAAGQPFIVVQIVLSISIGLVTQ